MKYITAKEYHGDRPCIPFIWIMLDKLGQLERKLKPAVYPDGYKLSTRISNNVETN